MLLILTAFPLLAHYCRDQCTVTSHSVHCTLHNEEQVRCNYLAASAAVRLTAKTNSGQITDTRLPLLCTAPPQSLAGCWLEGHNKCRQIGPSGGQLEQETLMQPKETLIVLVVESCGSRMLKRPFHMLLVISLPLCWQLDLHPRQRQSRNRALESTKSLGKKNKDKP